MKNQMFIPNSLQLKMLEKEKLKHQKKLDEIHSQDRKVRVIEKDIAVSLKLSQVRQHNIKLAQKGKAEELEQENEMLLGKLVQISRKKSPNFPIRSESVSTAKSLNAPFKKREMSRISSENEAFAKRLISQQSTFNRRKLDVDFKKHKELVSNMKRINSSPGKNFGKKTLPPIKSELTSPKAMSLKQSGMKSSLVKENNNKNNTSNIKKEQPQQESTVVASTVLNENQSVIVPAASSRKEEVTAKTNENIEVSPVKDNNTEPVLESGNLQKPQEVVGKPTQDNQSQNLDSARAEKVNVEAIQQEDK